jgi:hypothetical protein
VQQQQSRKEGSLMCTNSEEIVENALFLLTREELGVGF